MSPPAPSEHESALDATLNVLHLEDDSNDAELIEETLRAAGVDCRITLARSRREFLSALEGDAWDTILADYSLPSFNGLKALAMVRERTPETPFIFVTGAMGEDAAVETLKMGATNYVLKSHLVRLAPAVRHALREANERRKRLAAEAALANSERSYRRLFELNAAGVIRSTFEGTVLACNISLARMLGYDSTEELQALPASELYFNPADREALLDRLRTAGTLRSFEVSLKRKDGQPVWTLANGSLLEAASPGEATVEATIVDITEHKLAQLARARVVALVESSDDAIFAKTLSGIVETWNAGAERLYGYSAAEMVGTSVAILLPPGHPDEVRGILERIARGESTEHYETVRARKDGQLIDVSLTVSPIRNEAGAITGASTIARDITKRKRAEEKINELNVTLERRVAERTAELTAANKELESFSYSVSHDLRAPLRAMDGFCQALLEDYADKLDFEGKSYLLRVRAASQRMDQLVDGILGLSRLARSEMHRWMVDLSALAQTIALELQKTDPGRRVEFAIAPGLMVSADANLLRAVLQNLLGNAWKFTGKHPQARIEVGAAPHEQETAYFVRDDGSGFNMAYAGKLFGAFQRLHTPTEFEGTGIGLATVQRIIHRHGGRVWAEGGVETGATFYFTLPASAS